MPQDNVSNLYTRFKNNIINGFYTALELFPKIYFSSKVTEYTENRFLKFLMIAGISGAVDSIKQMILAQSVDLLKIDYINVALSALKLPVHSISKQTLAIEIVFNTAKYFYTFLRMILKSKYSKIIPND